MGLDRWPLSYFRGRFHSCIFADVRGEDFRLTLQCLSATDQEAHEQSLILLGSECHGRSTFA
jgi:hypothetical protein